LLLVAAALAGIVLGVVGMSYVGTSNTVRQVMDRLLGNSDATRARTAAEDRPEEAGREAHSAPRGDNKKRLLLTDDQIKRLGIEMATAQAGRLLRHLTLPGTVVLNAERVVHIVPRLSGVVRDVRKHLGDTVRAGDILASLDSRELADAKAAYLATSARVSLTEDTVAREKDLWEKKISAAQDYLTAKQALAEARIELRAAKHKLLALGISEASLQHLASQPETSLTRYELVALSAGTVIETHLTVGTLLKDDTEVFLVADLSTVWVHMNITPADVPLVHLGQRGAITAGSPGPTVTGTLGYLGLLVSEETRTVLGRVTLSNPDGRWRPGLFVTTTITVGETRVDLLIPQSALQTLEGQPSVFVQTSEGFEPRAGTLGRANATQVEITAGLQPGELYAITQTFLLKAGLGKPKDTDD
jgi:cobalt-zinc-cadmium efflux system membrane fusion protein